MSSKQEAIRALAEFKDIILAHEERLIGVGLIKSDDTWCVLYSRAKKPVYAEDLPQDVFGVKILYDFGNPPELNGPIQNRPPDELMKTKNNSVVRLRHM